MYRLGSFFITQMMFKHVLIMLNKIRVDTTILHKGITNHSMLVVGSEVGGGGVSVYSLPRRRND